MSRELIDVTPVMRAACTLAMREGHPHVGSEHLARLAIPGPGGLLEVAAAAGLECDATAIDLALATCCTDRAGTTDRATEPRLTPRTARMAAVAAQCALVDGSGAIAARHLVAALLREPDAIAWRGLALLGLSCAAVARMDVSLRGAARAGSAVGSPH